MLISGKELRYALEYVWRQSGCVDAVRNAQWRITEFGLTYKRKPGPPPKNSK